MMLGLLLAKITQAITRVGSQIPILRSVVVKGESGNFLASSRRRAVTRPLCMATSPFPGDLAQFWSIRTPVAVSIHGSG